MKYDTNLASVNDLTSKWIGQNSKKCPKYPWSIEKYQGCDHMTCQKRTDEFCWLCLADYQLLRKEGLHRHQESCKHYVHRN